ncbi:MAG: hypothetical protein IPL00_00145 [Gammaproteobacteria bacterium]|nr:hypothetical protein [Gammaproteobacteria bacterium]
MRRAFMFTALVSLIFGLSLGGCGKESDDNTPIEGHGSTFDEAVNDVIARMDARDENRGPNPGGATVGFSSGLNADDVASRLANTFSQEGLSLPSYTLVEWQSILVAELPPDAVADGVLAGAVLNFEGATAMDPMAFRNLLATFLVFDRSSQAEDFYKSFQDKARSHSNIAVEEFEISGAGIPTSAAQWLLTRPPRPG